MIDFGLSFVSNKIEDKAVDIYVLKRAFISSHPGSENLFERLLKFYKDAMCLENDKFKGLKIIAKFREVEMRGRKRECFG
jgi:TP53 regulating kinase-like protein